jgi:acyl-coenzyme A thioesterase PaaI-like protein
LSEFGKYLDIPDDVDADWTARRALSAAIVRLTEACVAGAVAGSELALVAAEANALADRLGDEQRTARDSFADGTYHDRPAYWIDRSALIGRCNPVAPPMHITFVDGRSISEFTLGQRHGGAPGIAHGGIVAAAFDQIMGHCATMHGTGGLTTGLTVKYRRPTPLGVPLRYECWLGQKVGPYATFEAVAMHGTTRLGTATADFKALKPEQAARIFTGGH